jgi:mRNA interferase RelE/StbE
MIWTELHPAAERELSKLDPQVTRHILVFLHDRVAAMDNPRCIGEALRGLTPDEFWKYRVGDYRVVANITDTFVRVLVVRLAAVERYIVDDNLF